MKRSKHQLLWSLAAALLAGTFLVSCSEDDALSSGTLLEGKYPLVLTAEIDGEATRASGKDAFASGDEIGVMLGTESTGKYVIGSDGKTLSPYDTDNTIYWQKLEATTVTGWYPYETTTSPVDISDQSSGYAAYDYLTATAENQAVGNTVKLKFQHQMAKVTFTLTAGSGVSLTSATVKIMGYTLATFSEGVLAGETNGEIAPYYDSETETYEALLVPQDMSNQQLIMVTTSDGTSYYYTPTSANLEAGCSYNFDITVGETVDYTTTEDGSYTVYTETGLLAWAAVAATDLSTNCTLGADITLTEPDAEGSNWTAIGDQYNPYSGTFDGAGYTISNLTINDTEDNGYLGLIGHLGVGEVKNLTLTDVSISSSEGDNIGGIAGILEEGATVTNCNVSGTIEGSSDVGGVVGFLMSGTVIACYSSATVSGSDCVGGVVGENGDIVVACYSTGIVSGSSNYVGGVVGLSCGTITACYFAGSVSGTGNDSAYIGGVVGSNEGESVTACYWTNSSTGDYAATSGIGLDYGGTSSGIYQVDSSSVYWSDSDSDATNDALSVMNTTLASWSDTDSEGNDVTCDWHYEENADSDDPPLLLAAASSSS